MAVNLLDMIKGAIAGQVSESIGSSVGLDKKQSSSALDALIPVLLGGMLKKASTPSGADELSKTIGNQDSSILGNLGDLLGSGKQSSLIEAGLKLLPSLLGGSQSSIVPALAKLLGISDKSITSLLGLLAPIAISVIGKYVKSQGLGVSDLTKLFKDQSSFLSSAIPGELQGAMGLTSMLGDAASSAQSAVTNNPLPINKLLKWVIPAVVVAGVAYLLISSMDQPKNLQKAPPTTPPQIVGDNINVDKLKARVNSTFNALTSSLEGITDETTATEAVEKVKEVATAFDGIGIDKLPDEAKTAVIAAIKPFIVTVNESLKKIYAIPGVQAIIEPVVNPFLEKVTALTGA